MTAHHRLTFAISSFADGDGNAGHGSLPVVVVPMVNGRLLIDLVEEYETSRGFVPAGGYGGLVPSSFSFGDLREHFLARSVQQWPRPGQAWVLACECGEAGCWPLTADIVTSADTVTWSTVSQEHRPQWDYTGFGPFVFGRVQYEHAVDRLVQELTRRERSASDAVDT